MLSYQHPLTEDLNAWILTSALPNFPKPQSSYMISFFIQIHLKLKKFKIYSKINYEDPKMCQELFFLKFGI